MSPRNIEPHTFKILVVDDNRDVADTFAMFVSMWGYPVRTAYNGPQALRFVSEWEPDCLFLDISMPLMDGYAVAQQLRAQFTMRKVTLIALSAFFDEAHLQKLQESGFDDFLIKPADPNNIKGILAKLELAATQKG
jgi:CheY-like chemotaxis protein